MVAIAASLVALTSASACGGGESAGTEGATPEQWVADVCGAVGSWMNDIEAGGTDLQQQAANTKSIAEGRELIVGFLDDTVTLTDRMLREVEAAGYPDVESGEDIASDFREELGKIRPAFVHARAKAVALPDDPEEFASGAQEIGIEMAAAGGSVGGRLEALGDKYKSPDLAETFDAASACQGL